MTAESERALRALREHRMVGQEEPPVLIGGAIGGAGTWSANVIPTSGTMKYEPKIYTTTSAMNFSGSDLTAGTKR